MRDFNVYTIPFRGRYIIWQPLNHFGFIGNKTTADLIEKHLKGNHLDGGKYNNLYSFLDGYGFFKKNEKPDACKSMDEYKPATAVLCMTSACNLSCIYCYAAGGKKDYSELSFENGTTAIDYVYANAKTKSAESFTVSFHGGGEPTLNPKKLSDLVAYARTKDLRSKIELTSNGFWNDALTTWVTREVDNLTLSFDGIREIHDRQRPMRDGSGTFDTIMKNISKLDASGMDYGIRLTVTNDSIAKLSESIEFLCKSTSCRVFQVEPVFVAGRGTVSKIPVGDSNSFAKNFLKAFDIATSYGRKLIYSGSRPEVITSDFCGSINDALIVTPDGKLTACFEVSFPSHPLAEIFCTGEINSSGEVAIFDNRRKALIKIIEDRKSSCKECFCFWHCAGDCPVRTIQQGNHINSRFSTRCKVNREITKGLITRLLLNNEGVYKKFDYIQEARFSHQTELSEP